VTDSSEFPWIRDATAMTPTGPDRRKRARAVSPSWVCMECGMTLQGIAEVDTVTLHREWHLRVGAMRPESARAAVEKAWREGAEKPR
jgi:ribosomal protein L34E